MSADLQLSTIALPGDGQTYQAIALSTRTPGVLLSTEVLNTWQLPPGLDRDRGVVLYGNAPIWLYSYGILQLSAFPWVGTYSLRDGAIVVVRSRVASPQPGDVLAVVPPPQPGIAILVGGPPNSGKSVLCNALRVAITRQRPDLQVYLHRANWDGEGNYIYESPHRQVVRQLKQKNKFPIPDLPNADAVLQRYFGDRARDTQRIRQTVDITLVDVGGIPDPVKRPVVEACSHILIISRDDTQIEPWLQLGDGLRPIAVIDSVRDDCCHMQHTTPYLRLKAGRWERDRPSVLPQVLLRSVLEASDRSSIK